MKIITCKLCNVKLHFFCDCQTLRRAQPVFRAVCCVVSCCVVVCSVVLCCVVLCVVVVYGPPHSWAVCVGVRRPSWSGVLRWGAVCCLLWRCVLWWCVAPRMVARAALVCSPPSWWCVSKSCVTPVMVGLCCVVLCCVVSRCVAVCCVVLCCVVCVGGVWPPSWWGVLRWCVAPIMVGCAALGCGVLCCVALCVLVVCGPSHGRACCGGVWPPSRWGVRCWLVLAGFFCFWCCCCLAGSGGPASGAPAVRHPLVLAGTDGPASRARAVRHPVLLFRGCRHPAARLPLFRFLVCAQLLARCWPVLSFAPPPPRWLCLADIVVAPLSFLSLRACWFPLLAACGQLLPPVVPPPLPPAGLVRVSLLPASCCLFSLACAPCCPYPPQAVLAPCPLPHPSWFVFRGCCRPAARFSLCARCLFSAALRLFSP